MKKISLFEKRQKFKFLQKKLSEESISIDEIMDFLRGERGVAPTNLTMIGLFNESIYRARTHTDENGFSKSLFTKVNDLKYPKESSYVTRKGRCNDVGEIILYGSTSEYGAITELVSYGMKLNSLFTVASIRRKDIQKNKVIFKPLGTDKFDETQEMNSYDKKFHGFCNSQFNQKISMSEQEKYNFTIAVSRYFLETQPKETMSGQKISSNFRFGIVYPSVHLGTISNKTTYNITMLPQVFDDNYTINEASVYVMLHDKIDNELVLFELNKGIVSGDEIKWQFTFEEMKSRALNGKIVYNDNYIKALHEASREIFF